MPLLCDYMSPPAYECVVQDTDIHSVMHLKEAVFKAMTQLDGWCSNEKAAVLIDLILWTQPQTIVEIGVFGGKSVIPMAFALRSNGFGKIYGVDPWSSARSAEGMEGVHFDWWSSTDHEAILVRLKNSIINLNLEKYIELIRLTSEDCPPIPNIDILHIDGNHSEKTSLLDVLKWVPLVRRGGIIIFDDVNWSTTKLAIEWLDEKCIKLAEFRGDNVWGIWIKP